MQVWSQEHVASPGLTQESGELGDLRHFSSVPLPFSLTLAVREHLVNGMVMMMGGSVT